jgi:hypothetical protein
VSIARISAEGFGPEAVVAGAAGAVVELDAGSDPYPGGGLVARLDPAPSKRVDRELPLPGGAAFDPYGSRTVPAG